MARLSRFSLSDNDNNKKWELKREGSGEVVKRFKTKANATKGGVLERAVKKMGSVRIRKRDGRIQEERTYPRSMDPRGRGQLSSGPRKIPHPLICMSLLPDRLNLEGHDGAAWVFRF